MMKLPLTMQSSGYPASAAAQSEATNGAPTHGNDTSRIHDWYFEEPRAIKAIDGHAHVFIRGLPLAPVRRHAPDYDATLDAYVSQLQENGISHAVLVQPSFLGTNNSFILDVLKRYPLRFRGVAMVEPAIAEAQLMHLDAAGFVGIRLNLMGLPIPDFSLPEWQHLLARVNGLGWHVEVHRQAVDLPHILVPLLRKGCRVVVDHFGRPDPELGTSDPGFQFLLSLGDTGQVWVKLSAAYRTSAGEAGIQFGHQATRLLLDAYPAEHFVWGSDWPHTQHREIVDYRTARQALNEWVPDAALRHTILTKSAQNLFRF